VFKPHDSPKLGTRLGKAVTLPLSSLAMGSSTFPLHFASSGPQFIFTVSVSLIQGVSFNSRLFTCCQGHPTSPNIILTQTLHPHDSSM
jgi:hypothetical protein